MHKKILSGKNIFIGNDIVDISLPENYTSYSNLRFGKRVFTSAELEEIYSAKDPYVSFWLHWAVKEAAYKVIVKIDNRFKFNFDCIEFVDEKIKLKDKNNVLFSNLTTQFDFVVESKIKVNYLYASVCAKRIAMLGKLDFVEKLEKYHLIENWQQFDNDTNYNFSSKELLSIYSPESCHVRGQIKRLLEDNYDLPVQVLREKRMAPYLMIDNNDFHRFKECDLSMSHDGAWTAAEIYSLLL